MPEPPLGSPTPRDRGGVRGAVGRIVKPIISVDPNAGTAINRITGSVRALKTEMQGLAAAAKEYAKAAPGGTGGAPGTARVTGFQPHMTMAGGPTGTPYTPGGPRWLGGSQQRVPGFQPHMVPPGGGPPGGPGGLGAGGGGKPGIFGSMVEVQIVEKLIQMAGKALGDTMKSGAVTNRLALMNQPDTGAFRGIGYGGGGTAGPYGGMLRKAGGYWSRDDLYQGGAILGRAGAIRGTDAASFLQAQRAGQLGQLSGTDFTGGAGIIANLQNSANQLRMANVQVSPGGKARDPADIFEQLYQRTTGGSQDKKLTGKMFQTGQAEGTIMRAGLKGLGLDDQTIDAFMAFGAVRAQRGKAIKADEFGRVVNKNISNASDSMMKFHKSMSQLTDSLSTSLLPLVTALAHVVSPVLDVFSKMIEPLGTLHKAVIVVGGAMLALAAKMAYSNLVGSGAQAANIAGVAGPGVFGGGTSGMATFGAQMVGGSLGVGLGSKVGKPGSGASKAGGVLGGIVGGAAAGGFMGAVGGAGVFSVPAAVVGGVIGGTLGGIKALFGDPVVKAWSGQHYISHHAVGDAQTDEELLSHPPPPATTPGGGPLPGGGNSANLNPTYVEALKAMFAENPKLSVTSGFRSHEEQAYLRWKHLVGLKPEPVAKVGTSRHETGNAADIGPSSEYKWLAENAPRFGLKATVGGEPWHWEMGGASASSWKPPPEAPSAKAAPAAGKSTKAADSRPKAVKKGKVRTTGQNEADWIQNILGQQGAPGGTHHEDIGDPVVSAFGMGAGRGGGGNTTVTIQNLTLKVEIAQGTPDEAERAARYLMEILSDRDKLEALARK